MKVFISWSNPISKKIAELLRDWLRGFSKDLEPWVSSRDIPKGKRWSLEVAGQLDESSFGLVCLAAGNLNEPWINFEAGALSKTVSDSHVVPILFDIEIADLNDSPLSQFQCSGFNEEDFTALIETMTQAAGVVSEERIRLRETFKFSWSSLETKINSLLNNKTPEKIKIESKAGELEVVEVQILRLLGERDGERQDDEMEHSYASDVARQISVKPIIARHHLSQLEKKDLVGEILVIGDDTRYYLTDGGRAYLVKNGLV